MDTIPDVDIDSSGRFKYVLLKVIDKESKIEKFIVRGYGHCQFHGDIFDEVENKETEKPGFELKCLGGGRIIHDPSTKQIQVFGYSTGYGKAEHEKSAEILKKNYPDYKITCSDEGY